MSERISIAKLREQFTLWPQVLCVLDTVEAAHRVTIALDSPHPNIAVIGCRAELDAALANFDFEDA